MSRQNFAHPWWNALVSLVLSPAILGCASVPAASPQAPQSVTGYGGVVFTADQATARVVRSSAGEQTVLFAGEEGDRPTRLLLYGGQLIVGGKTGLHSISLKDHTRTSIVDGLGPVVGVALDHVGYFIVATSGERPLVRVTPGGQITALKAPGLKPSDISFDPVTRMLTVTDARTGQDSELDYLTLVGDDRAAWKVRDARPMKPFTAHGVELTGGEYWPNRGDAATNYPDDVMWGFYPEKGVVFEGEAAPATPTKAAMDCAQTAYDALKLWIDANHESFLAATAKLGTSSRFYLWVNDYSEANDPFPHEKRPHKFWYWQRKPAVVGRVVGYWKWESSVGHDGTCRIPEDAQIKAYLADKGGSSAPK